MEKGRDAKHLYGGIGKIREGGGEGIRGFSLVKRTAVRVAKELVGMGKVPYMLKTKDFPSPIESKSI